MITAATTPPIKPFEDLKSIKFDEYKTQGHLIISFPKNKHVRMDICVEKKKQFFKVLYKAIED